MPKSKLRGGAKAHKLRVTHRNNTLRGLRKKAQAEYQEMFEKQMEALKVQYQNENGETVTETFIGLTARVALHEYDHMEGKVFTQKASTFETQRAIRKRMILQRKVKKAKK